MSTRSLLASVNLSHVRRDYAWYTVATLFNCEESYIRNLKDAMAGAGLSDYVQEYYVPLKFIQEKKKGKDGKPVKKVRKVKGDYSGYVFVKCILTARVWNFLRTTKGVAVVLTSGGFPDEISQEEIDKIRAHQAPEGFNAGELCKLQVQLCDEYKFEVTKPELLDSDFNTDFTT